MPFLSNSVYEQIPNTMAGLSNAEYMADLNNFKDETNSPFMPVQDLTKDALQTICDIIGINSYHPSPSDTGTENEIKEETVEVPEFEETSNPLPFHCDSADVKVERCPSPVTENRVDDLFLTSFCSPLLDSPVIPNDLRDTLVSEFETTRVPVNIFNTSLSSTTEPLLSRESILLTRLTSLMPSQPEKVRELQDFYKYQSALVETDRYRTLMMNDTNPQMKTLLNQFYDQELSQIIGRVEASVALLEKVVYGSHNGYMPGQTRTRVSVIKTRSLLSKQAVKLMEEWYDMHLDYPYPDVTETDNLARTGGLSHEQVRKWFANKRNRSANTRSLTHIASVKRKRAMLS